MKVETKEELNRSCSGRGLPHMHVNCMVLGQMPCSYGSIYLMSKSIYLECPGRNSKICAEKSVQCCLEIEIATGSGFRTYFLENFNIRSIKYIVSMFQMSRAVLNRDSGPQKKSTCILQVTLEFIGALEP